MKNKAEEAKTITAYCGGCKSEQEFYDLKDLKVCTHCLRSIRIEKKRKAGNQKELFV